MAYTVIWYGRKGIIDKVTFDAEKVAKDHAMAMFQTRRGDDGAVSVEVRKDNGLLSLAMPRTSAGGAPSESSLTASRHGGCRREP
ncbi:hypothetical protein [Mesorhizobium sp. ES1-3]|uniref:hypothetical protein n=1 Tax=Mesorhizobium sp. ES1-3 TaxID=2876628 RepID=UPI001CCDB115|nr:hypothetical protein [Mesorhizobium sp. ES1-3]MBZ9669049.1 hypothetical protein [Mesorhizobium sp. ES1-3]